MTNHSAAPAFVSGPKPPAHLYGSFDSDFERRSALRKFFRAGLFACERCAINVDAEDPADTLSAIGTADEIARWCDEGLLTVVAAPSADGLDVDDMIDVWNSFIETAKHTPARIGGEATWWLHLVAADKLIEYEAELECAMPQQLSALCLYDRRRFDADLLERAMRIHPHKVTASRMFVTNEGHHGKPDRSLS